MSQMPWDAALLAATQQQAEALARAEEEILRLRVTVANLTRRLREARIRQENWLLRQQAWRAERTELLTQLSPEARARASQLEKDKFRFRDDGP